MSEKKENIIDIENFSKIIRQYYKEIEKMYDSLKESLDEVNARLDKYFGKENR